MSRVVVAGAGAWGGWSALHLRRAGHEVTLVDPWGPGNARASSGDESRIVRANYGAASHCVGMGVRALELWRAFETEQRVELIRRCGLLWMERSREEAHRASLPLLRDAGVRYEELSAEDVHRRYPQINPVILDTFGLSWGASAKKVSRSVFRSIWSCSIWLS